MESETKTLSVRVPLKTAEALDEFVERERAKRPHETISRADAVRTAIAKLLRG